MARGKGRKGGGNGRKPRGPRTNVDEAPGQRGRTDLIEKLDMNNERFTAYYKKQNMLPDGEFDEMLEAFRRHLPTTFRVAGSRQTVHSLNKTITDVHVPSLSDVTFEDEKIPPPVQIPWYPDGYAWQFNVPKKVLRKSPEFKKFHSFLVFETEVGNISRQEAVSMLPPLFLNVEPHHKVMDMCAAPGSKTAQILEALHANDAPTSSSIPSGLLIANDSDNKRTHLLIHQSARLPSPSLMVTNLDASNFPIIRIPNPNNSTQKLETMLFDRILCDVPCSGDGTMRKNLGIWKSWQPMDGNGLHSLQVRILQRAMRMLTKEGRIVYSTCSLNPIENEAVICAALKSNPAFELVDVSDTFPTLLRYPGMKSWIPSVDRFASAYFNTYEELKASSLDDATKSRFSKTQWPPENIEDLHIERCMRIYPHLQDTGGFFVAVLKRKKKATTSTLKRQTFEELEPELPESKRPRIADEDSIPTPVEVEVDVDVEVNADADVVPATGDKEVSAAPSETSSETMDTTEDPTPAASSSAAPSNGGFKENPYTYLPPDHPALLACLAKVHTTPSFPSQNILIRTPLPTSTSDPTATSIRSFYITNPLIKSIITHNDYTKLRLTSAGTKVFAKQEAAGAAGKGPEAQQYRVLGEGLAVVLPFIEERTILSGGLAVLKAFLGEYYPLVRNFEKGFRDQIDESSTGSLVVRFRPEEFEGAVLTHELVLPIWKSNVSLSLMIDKKAKSALSLRLFGEDLMAKGKADGNKKEDVESKGEVVMVKEDEEQKEEVEVEETA